MAAPALCHFKRPSIPQVTLPFSAPQGAPTSPLPPTPSVLLLIGLAQSQGCRSAYRGLQREEGCWKGAPGSPAPWASAVIPGSWASGHKSTQHRSHVLGAQVFCRGRQKEEVQAAGMMRLFHQPLNNPGPAPAPSPLPQSLQAVNQ